MFFPPMGGAHPMVGPHAPFAAPVAPAHAPIAPFAPVAPVAPVAWAPPPIPAAPHPSHYDPATYWNNFYYQYYPYGFGGPEHLMGKRSVKNS